MVRSPRPAWIGFAVLAAALCALPAGAELAKWDQARVTQIAQQLANACNAWWKVTLDQPESDEEEIGSGVAAPDSGLTGQAHALQEQSTILAGHLGKGKGYHETLDMYRTLREIYDDSSVAAPRADLDDQSLAAWNRVSDLMGQIAPFYDPNASASKSQD